MQLRIPEVTLLEDGLQDPGSRVYRALHDGDERSVVRPHEPRLAGEPRFTSEPPPGAEAGTVASAASGIPSCSRLELRTLESCWQRAAQSGTGAFVSVLGAAGSGKSRLVAAFSARIAESGVQVLSVRCRNRDWAPFSALKRLLDAHLAGLAELDPQSRAERETSLRIAAGPMASHAKLLSPRLGELFHDAPPAMAEGDVQQFFVAGMADFVAKYLEFAGRSLIVLDDVHWLDASSRLVLSRVAARLCPQGHLVLCAARDDVESRELLERFGAPLAREQGEVIRLGALPLDGASQVIAESLGIDEPPVELVDQLTQLSDGTPLSLLELLRSTLERGHLKPIAGRFQLDVAQVQRMRLPASSQALIERRLVQLDPGTHEVLRAAAVLRDHVDPELLAHVTGLDRLELQQALERSTAAHLLELDAHGEYTFIHDTVWEALLAELSDEARLELHARAAEALLKLGGSGADYDYEVARHCAAGMLERDPALVFETNRRAARRALEACDDMLASSFLKAAEEGAQRANLDPGRELYAQLAETHLRTGDMQQSLHYFECALARSYGAVERAYVRGRMAWVHHFEANEHASRQALAAALAESGRTFPADKLGSFALAAGRWALATLRGSPELPKRPWSAAVAAAQQQAQTLSQLYAACVRVAVEGGQPFSMMSSMLDMARSAKPLPPSREVVHSELLMSFLFSTLGLEPVSRKGFARAERMARSLGDPIAQTLVHAVQHAWNGWKGNLEESERQARLCVDERGHWMELGELCHVCYAMYGIEVALGRPALALAWTERAIERVRQYGRAPAMFALIEDAAASIRIALGRERELPALERSLRFVQRSPLSRDGYFYVLSFLSRVQRFTETGDLGAEFEALLAEFERLQINPRRVHLLAATFYTHVVYARLHQCLRADPAARAKLVPKLERAFRDHEASNRLPVMTSHNLVVRGALRWFAGDVLDAKRLIADAERLAEEHGCPWASFWGARVRAHILRAEGKTTAARDVARVAAVWAQQYSHHSWLRLLSEEFELGELSPAAVRGEVEAPSTRRNLDALLRISQANSRELGPERQARLILDELIEALGAERALLFMRTETAGGLALATGRARGAGDLAPNARYDRALVEQVYATGQPQLAEVGSARSDRACLAAALVLREQAVGVLYLDRPGLEGSFRSEDTALLSALANQVSVALELVSSLRERERLQHHLQQAQTMEAIGRLAGGIAHDFNNILSAIQFAATSLVQLTAERDAGREDIADIQSAARRGAALTRQLLGLSRGQTAPPPPRRVVLGDIVQELLPMLRRLVRQDVHLELELAEEPLATLADLSQIERVLMNLCQNASDAMPHGGTITIRVAAAGRDVLLSVSDTGTGMNEEVRSRLFEPFFTTKPSERGTGLGLANVFGIVQQCGGRIEVVSELGAGSCFKLWLPCCTVESEPPPPLRYVSELRPGPAANSGRTVLVVDDDEAVRRMVVRTLERGGYGVVSAHDGESALELVNRRDVTFDMVVTDMCMPGISGSELARGLLDRHPEMKVLFLSGDESGELEHSGLATGEVDFLHKPFLPDELLSYVHRALEDDPAAVG